MLIKLENLLLTIESIKGAEQEIQGFYNRLDDEILDAVLSNIIDRYCRTEYFDKKINEY